MRATGTIANLATNGYGFIDQDGGGRIYFHRSALPRGVEFAGLFVGQRVEFTPTSAERGARAEALRLL